MRTPSRLLALAAVGALTLTACSGDDADSPGQIDTVDPTEDTSPTPLDPGTGDETSGTTPPDGSASPTDGDTEAAADLNIGGTDGSAFCALEPELDHIERVEFAYPAGWQVEDGNCEFFDAELDELPEGTEPQAAIGVRVADQAFDEVADNSRSVREDARYVGAFSGYQGVRSLGESTGQGLYPEGQPALTYFVDLDAGTDDRGGTLILTAHPTDGTDFALAREALDRMIATVRIVPSAVETSAPTVIVRSEGGGAPYAVTFEDGCFRLHAGGPTDDVTDEACDLDPTAGDIVGTVLGDDTVVGHAPPLASFVVSDAASAPYGAVTTGIEGGALFAYQVIDQPVDVRAVDVEGDVLARATIGS